MKTNYNILIKKFTEIANNGWIEGESLHPNSIGLTFEKQLKKNADSMFLPDFYGIEIKCKSRFSNYPISIFTQSFDGPALFETNEILEKYGKRDYQFKDRKTLITNLKTKERILFNNKYYLKLKIDRKKEKLFLQVYDTEYNLLEEKSYVEFNTLKTKIELKLKNLALILASKKIIDKKQYHRYYKIIIYELYSFENFINLLDDDIIKVTLICRVSRSGDEAGRQRNKNLVFLIDQDNLEKLFKLKFIYDHDLLY